ncbi:MAG TPA: DUF2380 domain-containing protein [Gemmatimonadales bacterium]|nr:DUF2380 domain-containing protein [Gemmatimonadales bacterium]
MLRFPAIPILTAAIVALPRADLAAQGTGPEPATAAVAVLPAALYNDQANLREASDSDQAVLATEVLRSRLVERLGDLVVSYRRVDSLARSPEAMAIAGGVPCQVKVACARAVAAGAGARWVVMAKVSKTSSLIWLLSAQLIRVSTGEIVLDDSTELKGDPGTMVRVGVRSFADRVARTVRAGGRTTNFPSGSPGS